MILANLHGRYITLHDKDREVYSISITKENNQNITITVNNYQISGFFMPFDL